MSGRSGGGGAATGSDGGRPRGAAWTGRVALALASALLSLLLLEAAAEVWLHLLASDEQFRLYASLEAVQARAGKRGRAPARFAPHRYLGYIPTPGFVEGEDSHDEFGFRGEPFPRRKPPGEFRIFCLGGSTTYTTFVRQAAGSYPARLEEELHRRGYEQVRVINAGAPGYTTYETLISFVMRVHDLDPDMIIVYHGINDVSARMVWPPKHYRGDNSGWIGPGGGWFTSTPLLQRLALVRVVLLRLGRIRSANDLIGQVGPPSPPAKFWQFVTQKQRGTYPSGIFERAPVDRMLQRNPPIYFRRNVEHLVALARQWGVRTVLATFAVNREKGDLYSSPEILDAIEEQNAILRELGAQPGVELFDYAAVAPTRPDLYWDGTHVFEEGARLKAERFADFLVEAGLPSAGRAASRAGERR